MRPTGVARRTGPALERLVIGRSKKPGALCAPGFGIDRIGTILSDQNR
jgi:hypothetical protein